MHRENRKIFMAMESIDMRINKIIKKKNNLG